eukprot:UN11013
MQKSSFKMIRSEIQRCTLCGLKIQLISFMSIFSFSKILRK